MRDFSDVLVEIVLTCRRSGPGGRISIWPYPWSAVDAVAADVVSEGLE